MWGIEIKKLGKVEDIEHRVDIFNHHLMVYLKHGNTRIKGVYVEDPSNGLMDIIDDLKNSVDFVIESNTYINII